MARAYVLTTLVLAVACGAQSHEDESPAAHALDVTLPTHTDAGPVEAPAQASGDAQQDAAAKRARTDAGQSAPVVDCDELQGTAYEAFTAAVAALDITQCETDLDCDPRQISHGNDFDEHAFHGYADGCWVACKYITGTEPYAQSLKDIAARVCSEHRAAGCMVRQPPCPMQNWPGRCVEGACNYEDQ